MSLAAELAAVLARHGVPSVQAVQEANELSARMLRKLERDARNKRIADLFCTVDKTVLFERFGLHRSTVYRIVNKVARKKLLATTPE